MNATSIRYYTPAEADELERKWASFNTMPNGEAVERIQCNGDGLFSRTRSCTFKWDAANAKWVPL